MKLNIISRFFLILFLLTGISLLALAKSKIEDNLATYDRAETLTQRVRALLVQENYVALDFLAHEARTSKARFSDGEWKLFVFYAAVTTPATGAKAGESDWEPHLEKLQRWYKTSSKSVTSHIVYGGGLIEYALKAHVGGQEWNAMGTEVGGRVFQARLKTGLNIFNGLKKIKDRCPHLYYVQIKLAMAQGWSWAEFNMPYAEGIALEPSYHYFYQAKAFNLLPRNRGGQGEWENYANETYRQLGIEEGALTYYLMVSHLRSTFGSSLFAHNRIYWERLKEGYQILLSRYLGNNLRHNEMAFFASLAKDQASAKAAFDRIGNSRNSQVWASQASFEQKRAWANEQTQKAVSKAHITPQ